MWKALAEGKGDELIVVDTSVDEDKVVCGEDVVMKLPEDVSGLLWRTDEIVRTAVWLAILDDDEILVNEDGKVLLYTIWEATAI